MAKIIEIADCPARMRECLDMASAYFKQHAVHQPYVRVWRDNKLYSQSVIDEMADKDSVEILMIKHIVSGADAVAFVDEAWRLPKTHDEWSISLGMALAAQGRLREHPDAEEVVMLQYENTQVQLLAQAKIIRPGPSLGDWEVLDGSKAAGRFANLFAKAANFKRTGEI